MKTFHQVGMLAVACMVASSLSPFCAAAGEPLGLVLSGGGAKGAYEVGVWQALEEMGWATNIEVISGTSVGALNAALFAVRPEEAEALWLEHMGEIFTMNKERVGKSIQTTLDQAGEAIERYNHVLREQLDEAAARLECAVDDLPPAEVEIAEKAALRNGIGNLLLSLALRIGNDIVDISQSDVPRDGYIDSSRLAAAIDATLSRDWPDGAPAVYATALEKGADGMTATWLLNGEPHERRKLMLRASAAIPFGFDTVEIDGKTYVDGGWESQGGDNVPIGPVLENRDDVQTVIVVYLADKNHLPRMRFEANRAAADAAGVRLVEIVPSEDIGGWFWGKQGTFDARPETAKHLMELGREDARRVLGGMGGGIGSLDNENRDGIPKGDGK